MLGETKNVGSCYGKWSRKKETGDLGGREKRSPRTQVTLKKMKERAFYLLEKAERQERFREGKY